MHYRLPEEKPWSVFSSGAQKETSSTQITDEFVAAEYGRVIYFLTEKKQTHLAIHWCDPPTLNTGFLSPGQV